MALLDATRLIAELADGGTSADRIRDATLSRITLGWPGQVVPPVEPDPLVSSSGLAVDLWLKTIDRRGIARHLVLGPHPEAARFTSIPLFE